MMGDIPKACMVGKLEANRSGAVPLDFHLFECPGNFTLSCETLPVEALADPPHPE